jgi:hypothetical protein
MKNRKQCTLLSFLGVMEALRRCKAKGLAGTHCHIVLLITVFSPEDGHNYARNMLRQNLIINI